MPKTRFTFADITKLTLSEDASIALAENLRWGDEIACHRCGGVDIARLGGRPGRYRCRGCAQQFSIRTGTPMEASKLPISVWMRALWLIAISSKGISSVRLGEMLGVQQKTAWFLARRIREMMAWLVSEPIPGAVVELDEVCAGAPPRQKAGGGPSGAPSGRGPRRPLVLTAASRDGGVRMTTIASHSRAAISEAVVKVVGIATVFVTDALPAYRFLDPARESVKHSAKEFARTTATGLRVHVNTAESAHADLRRMVLGVHHWISRKHLDRYLGDLSFRRSWKDVEVLDRMRALLMAPSRLTCAGLIAKPPAII